MNRIEIRFYIDPRKGNRIGVGNDIKGLTYYPLIAKVVSRKNDGDNDAATDLFMLLTSVDYKKLDNYMSYGVDVTVIGKYNDPVFKSPYYQKLFEYCANKGYDIKFTNRN